MSKSLTRFRVMRGTTSQRIAIILFAGELCYDTELETMFVGNGTTFGGVPFSGESSLPNIAKYTSDQVLTVEDYVIADSASPIEFTLQDATGYDKPVTAKNANSGLLTISPMLAQPIYANGVTVTDVQIPNGDSFTFVPKSGVWYVI